MDNVIKFKKESQKPSAELPDRIKDGMYISEILNEFEFIKGYRFDAELKGVHVNMQLLMCFFRANNALECFLYLKDTSTDIYTLEFSLDQPLDIQDIESYTDFCIEQYKKASGFDAIHDWIY